MIWNYFKIAWRNLKKDKIFTGVNLFGLSISFGVALLLSVYALYQLSFDKFHLNEVYQVYSTDQTPKGPQAGTAREIPFAAALNEEVPGIKEITRYNGISDLVLYEDKELNVVSAYVDPGFFSIFNFPIIQGNSNNPISEKTSVAITRDLADRIFGHENVVGKTIEILKEGESVPFTISAIIKDLPEQSSMNFDLVLNFRNLPDFMYGDNVDSWDKANHEVYLQLEEGMTPQRFEEATREFAALHYSDRIANAKRDGAQPDANGVYKQFRLTPFSDTIFTSFENGKSKISRTRPYLVLGIAFLILFIGCVNFINLSIAKSSQRLKEVGMRKTLGAGKLQLFLQFWGESIILFVGALILGLLLMRFLLDPFQTLFNINASFNSVSTPVHIAGAILCVLIITIIAGGYPALLQSRLSTLQALKGKMEITGKNRLRNFLMVMQFGIAILLISGTLVLQNQLQFMRSIDLGFNKEQVIAFPLNGKKDDQRVIQLLRNELQDKPGIVSVSAANNILGLGRNGSRSTSIMGFEHEGRGVTTNILMVDHDYIETLGLEVVEGRSFSRNFSDSLSVVINETMEKELNEEDVLAARITLDDSVSYSVVGVLRNYHFQDLDRKIQPLTLFLKPQWNMHYAYVKVHPQHISSSFEQVKRAWDKVEPQAEFLGSFLDENIDRTLRTERTMTTLIMSGSVVAIALSCTGLFAISLLVVAQRRKEIGIRKVIGASASTITFMLTLGFLKLVAIAFLIAAPLAWWFSRKWIQNYPYRMELEVWIFLAAGGIAVTIAILTVGFQALKAATANPVNSLKSE